MLTPKENYTWAEFQAAVLGLLGVDADREGIDTFRSNLIRQAVIEVQALIPQYRCRHETVYYPGDLVYEAQASKGVKPPQSILKDLWLCEVQRQPSTVADQPGRTTGKVRRYGLDPYDWDKRQDLINGRVTVNHGRGKYCVDPNGYEFYVYPAVYDDWLLSVFWDGRKLDFKDAEETPFDEQLAGVVALKVKGQIVREAEQNPAMKGDYEADYRRARALAWADKREESQ